jgi:hypothetical protein
MNRYYSKTIEAPVIHKDTAYYSTLFAANMTLDTLKPGNPEARIVEYTRGWALQQKKSGRYFNGREWL